MATNLYEVLGINRNATSEQIRRAYRRKALETHPDRLPQGASAADKSVSEDLFRNVNNAYEVLSDPQNRAEYDRHGIWPPPEPTPNGPYGNGQNPFPEPFARDPFSHPFFRRPRMDPFSGFGFGPGSRPGHRGFTDPFVLFDSIFGDLHRAFEADSFGEPFERRGFGSNDFVGGFFGGGIPSMLPPAFDFGSGSMRGSMMQSVSNGGSGGRWASESWTTSTVNGVTHTKCVRRDSEGNEHVTYQYPDGTERRTINGVEQSAFQPQRALPPSVPPAPPVPYPTPDTGMPPPPPYVEAVGQPPSHSRPTRHVHYGDYPSDRREHRHRHGHEHEYSPRDKERNRGRDYETKRGHGYRDDGQGHDAQDGSFWRSWRP